MELIDEPKRPVAQVAALRIVQLIDAPTGDRYGPAVGRSSPPSSCNSVVLPDPDAPTMATRSPSPTVEIDSLARPRREVALLKGLRQRMTG